MKQKMILSKVAEKGFITCIRIMCKYVKKHVCGISRVIIFERDLQQRHTPTAPLFSPSFKNATKEDIQQLNKQEFAYDKKNKQYAFLRIDKGDKCILAMDNKQIIGYIWVMYDQMELSPKNYIPLSTERAYVYNIFVIPSYRKKKLSYGMDNYLFERFKQQQIRYVVVTVDMDTPISKRSRQHAGFIRIGLIIKFRFFGLKYDFVSRKVRSYLLNTTIASNSQQSKINGKKQGNKP